MFEKEAFVKIGELSKIANVSTHTIRYYEKTGLLDTPKKDHSGHRYYNENDVDLINWVICLKKSNMPLNFIKEYIQAYNNKQSAKLIKMLEIHLKKLTIQKVEVEHYLEVTTKKLNSSEKRLT